MNKWRILKSAVITDRRPWIRVCEHEVLLPNGTHLDSYITWEEREYALVVATTRQGIPLVRQYKHGVQSYSLDLPGGYLNENETPLIAAQRELMEETGLAAGVWKHLGSLVLDNNRGRARAHLYFAREARVVTTPTPDTTEDLSIQYYPRDQVGVMIRDGSISSLPSVTAILMAWEWIENCQV